MSNYEPKTAIVIYKKDTSLTYCEVHNIKDGEFGPGRPLTKSELEDISILAKDQTESESNEAFPFRNILAFNLDTIKKKVMWIYPAGKIKLLFSNSVSGIKSGEYYIPNIIFKYNRPKLHVYAIKNKDISKLEPGTKIYKAPFMNVGYDGDVCMGSVKVKKARSINDIIKNVETSFFNSLFTHFNDQQIVKGNCIDMFNNQKSKFEEKYLIESQKLEDLW